MPDTRASAYGNTGMGIADIIGAFLQAFLQPVSLLFSGYWHSCLTSRRAVLYRLGDPGPPVAALAAAETFLEELAKLPPNLRRLGGDRVCGGGRDRKSVV